MSKQQDPGYKPLSMHARWKLNRAVKALRSPFHSVRAAAHREIQKILAKAQQRGQRVQKAVKEKLKREPRQKADRPARPPRPKRHRCSCGKSFHSREFFNAHARKHAREGRQVPARSRQARSQQAAQPARALLTPKDLKARQRARKQAAKAARKAPAPRRARSRGSARPRRTAQQGSGGLAREPAPAVQKPRRGGPIRPSWWSQPAANGFGKTHIKGSPASATNNPGRRDSLRQERAAAAAGVNGKPVTAEQSRAVDAAYARNSVLHG